MLETCKHNLFRNWFVKWRHLFWKKELVEDLLLDKRGWIWGTIAIQRLRVFTNKNKRVEFDCKFFKGKWRVEDYSKFCLQYTIERQTKERPPKDPIWFKILEAIFSATRRLISPLINLLPQHFCHNQLNNTRFYHLQRSNDFCHIFMYFCKMLYHVIFINILRHAWALSLSPYVPIFHPMR